jgi:hypothetical protein
MLLLVFATSSLAAADKPAAPTLWTLGNIVESCALAQGVDVQKELKLSAAQLQELKTFVDRWRKNNREFTRANRRPTAEQLQKQHAALLADLGKIIKPEQLTRLRQIYYQCEGIPSIVLNHEEKDTLFQPTPRQRQQLVEIQVSTGKKRADAATRALAAKKNAIDQLKATRAAETEILRQVNEAALAVLNKDQKEAWERLIGKPFKGKLVDAKGKWTHAHIDAL